MRIVNLIENTPGVEGCAFEHGLSFYVETQNHKIILDTGASGAFVDNANVLGIDLTKVDILVLSHGHYDHSGGVLRFAKMNPNAKIYMQRTALLGYYHIYPDMEKYIGIDEEIKMLPQLVLLDGDVVIDEELSIFTRVTGRRAWPKGNLVLARKTEDGFVQDNFSHEQYLVISDDGEKVLISGCAHNGIINILDKYAEVFGGCPDMVISGFHMMKKTGYNDEDWDVIKEVAYLLKSTDAMYYTGHCTGEEPYFLMKEIMGEQLVWVHSGQTVLE